MERLTDRKTAADLKANYEGLRAAGMSRDIATERYIKLAEYENQQLDRIAEEKAAKLQTTLYICDPEKNTECIKTNCKAYNHGECDLTMKREAAEQNDDGEPKIYNMAYQESSRGFHTDESGER